MTDQPAELFQLMMVDRDEWRDQRNRLLVLNDEKKAELRRLRADMAELEKSESHTVNVQALIGDNKAYQTLMQQQKETIENLSKALDTKSARIRVTEETIQRRGHRISALENENATLHDELEKRATQLEAAHDRETAARETKKAIDQVQQVFFPAKEEVEKLRKENADLRDQLLDAQKNRYEATEQLDEVEDLNKNAKDRIAALEAQLKDRDLQIADRDYELTRLLGLHKNRVVELENLGRASGQKNVEIANLRKQKTDLEAVLDTLRQQNAELETAQDNYNSELEEKDRGLDTMRRDSVSKELSITNLVNEIERIRGILATRNTELQTERRVSKTLTEEHKVSKERLYTELENLRRDNFQKDAEPDNLRKRITSLESALATQHRVSDGRMAELNILSDRLHESRVTVNELQRKRRPV